MADKGETITIGAFNLERKVDDIVEITQGTQAGIVHIGKVLEVIKDASGTTLELIVKILA